MLSLQMLEVLMTYLIELEVANLNFESYKVMLIRNLPLSINTFNILESKAFYQIQIAVLVFIIAIFKKIHR